MLTYSLLNSISVSKVGWKKDYLSDFRSAVIVSLVFYAAQYYLHNETIVVVSTAFGSWLKKQA